MPPPAIEPNPHNLDAWRSFALEYLAAHFKGPLELGGATTFPRSPLHGEGAVAIFPFKAAKDGRQIEPYFVAVGQTEPNYYPAYELSPEDAYCLHLGTRFMLVMGVATVSWSADDGYEPAENARELVARVVSGCRIENVQLAAMFDVDGELHAVLRADLDARPVYIMGRDAPAGFSTRTDLPAPVAYRLHIGHVLLAEPDLDHPHQDAASDLPIGPKKS